MKRFIQRVLDSMRRAWIFWVHREHYRCVHVAELPNVLLKGRIYLIGDNSPWYVALCCPCGCNAVIQLSLLPTDSPSWEISFDVAGRPTLTPSVWRIRGCRSHFFLQHGFVVWYRPNGKLQRGSSYPNVRVK